MALTSITIKKIKVAKGYSISIDFKTDNKEPIRVSEVIELIAEGLSMVSEVQGKKGE